MESLRVTLTDGASLLDAVLNAGARLAHDCGGKLACAACSVVVREFRGMLSEPTDDELDMLDRSGVTGMGSRLACQVTGNGEVVIDLHQGKAPPNENGLPITITPEAARFLGAQLAKHPGSVGIRLSVAPAGCTGLRYLVDPIDIVGKDDAVFESGGIRIAVDPGSLPFLQGTTLRLEKEGIEKRLRFSNPNAMQHCGCGESFST